MWAIRGRIVPLTSEPTVAANEAAAFTGRVWIGDEGTIITVTKGTKAGSPKSDNASIIDVGNSLVLPGLIDLHNHLAYMIKKVPHPSSRDAIKLIAEWRSAVTDLRTVVTPDPGGNNSGPNYGDKFTESDYAPIPHDDLPFGMPSWLGDDSLGGQSRPKRRNTVERDAADPPHTLIWRAPTG